jgi:hypothetical protein
MLRFFVDAIVNGRVLGIDASAGPDEATAALGDDYAENQGSRAPSKWRDYGVVEVHWIRDSAGVPWRGHHISIQAHRLGCGEGQDPMNANVRASYGGFPSRLRFEALRDALGDQGCVLTPVPRHAWDVLEFAHVPTAASIPVATTAATVGVDDGWQIALSAAASVSA